MRKDHRGNPAITVLTPCDAPSAYNMVLEMAEWPSAVYLRALRADTDCFIRRRKPFRSASSRSSRRARQGQEADDRDQRLPDAHGPEGGRSSRPAGIDVTLVDAYCLPFESMSC